jgi:hypothetical protein
VNHFSNQGCPASLVGRTQSLSGISMEVFMKKKVVFEVWILLKLGLLAIDWAIPIFVSRK